MRSFKHGRNLILPESESFIVGDVSIPRRSNKISGSILICTPPDVMLESKSPAILLFVLETLVKMIPPEISEEQGDVSRDALRDEGRDRDEERDRDVVVLVTEFNEVFP
mmetsp:Transcript_33976/g.40684  ORF Transcript_33976/g.40684 Transcript_33976/m.40684 type:complete len:109 (+) Transcript_33976:533-859(+)